MTKNEQQTSFRESWVSMCRNDADALKEFALRDPFVNWERNRNPGGTAEDLLWAAVEVLFGASDNELAKKLLVSCLSVSEKILSSNILISGSCASAFPVNRSRVLRTYAYAKGLLGLGTDFNLLQQAADDALVWCFDVYKGKWGPATEEAFASSIRVQLIKRSFSDAVAICTRRRKLIYHRTQCTLWARSATEGDVLEESSPLRTDIVRFFDMIRNPCFNDYTYTEKTLLLLEVGAILEIKHTTDAKVISWDRVIDAIAS